MGDTVKHMLLGMGNRLNRDDAAGSVLAEEFNATGWVVVDGGQMPENYTGVVKRERPGVLVIVDTTGMDLEPGEIRRIPLEKLSTSSLFNTHAAPPSMFISYLQSFVDKIYFIGIQPGDTTPGEGISNQVRTGMTRLEKILEKQDMETIPKLD